MRPSATPALLLLLVSLLALPARAEWFDDYQKGLDAASAKNWDTVIASMNAALAAKPDEGNRERTYGVNFVNYRPYYYLGVAYMNQGEWAKAIENLSKTGGAGPVNLGDPNTLLITANNQLAAEQIRQAQQPPVTPPTTRQPDPPRPDPALGQARTKAENAIRTAREKFNRAQQADAATNAAREFDTGSSLLRQATSASIDATTKADFDRVAELADRAGRAFDASVSASELRVAQLERDRKQREEEARRRRQTQQQQQQQPPAPSAPTTPPDRATADVLNEARVRLKDALEAYFDGEFSDSARKLEQLSLDQPNNPMIFAFLGASHFYEYYLEGERDAGNLEKAREAFRTARSLRPGLELDSNYFSARLRAFYQALD